jgi:ribosomal protein L11 methyltransferase
MAWVSIAIEVEPERAEALADALLESGALSVDVSDARVGTAEERPIFDEPHEAAADGWTRNRVCALFAPDTDVDQVLRGACEQAGVPVQRVVRLEPVAEQDWVRLTQEQFTPIAISERLWIVPSWCEPPMPDAINLRLDPGLAFGTGSHPTTAQCLRWLDQNLRAGDTVLDYGCGSGVLAIAARRLGAGDAVGVDIDPNALRAGRDNALLNGVKVQFVAPDQLGEASFDLVVANILANPLRVLAPLLAARTSPGGNIVLAGILEMQAEAVRSRYVEWFDSIAITIDDGWACVTGVRRVPTAVRAHVSR